MTGDEIHKQMVEALRAEYWLLQRPEDVEQAFAEALANFTPCKVLTADEAAFVVDALSTYGPPGDRARALALLTPKEKNPKWEDA